MLLIKLKIGHFLKPTPFFKENKGLNFSKNKGFTIIEVLIVIAIFAILSAIVILAVNPAQRLAQARNVQRFSDVRAIRDAIYQRITEKGGIFAFGTVCDTLATAESTITSVDGNGKVDICNCLVPDYIAAMPSDPSVGYYKNCNDYNTGYTVINDSATNLIVVKAPLAELGITITTGPLLAGGGPSNWANESFDKCRDITLTGGNSDFTDFPYYINLSRDSDMQDDYDDLRFYDAPCNSGGAELNYEIENYTASNAQIWVKIPSLPISGKTISVYYHNTTVNSGENPNEVWDSNYKMVQHLEEIIAGDGGVLSDSTSNNANGITRGGVTTDTAGKINGADNFDGINDYSTINSVTQYLDSIFTISFWMNTTVVGGDRDEIMFSFHDSAGGNKFRAGQQGGRIEINNNGVLGSAIVNDGNWHNIAVVSDGTNYDVYVNGSLDLANTSTSTNLIDSDLASLAQEWDGAIPSDFYTGGLDEVCISNTVRSADWIRQSYQTVKNQDTFVIVGSEQVKP